MTPCMAEMEYQDEVNGHQWASHKLRRVEYGKNESLSFRYKSIYTEQWRRFDNGEMSKEELLYYLRELREGWHRKKIQSGFDRYALCWTTKPSHRPTQDVHQVARLRRAGNIQEKMSWIHDFFEVSNKSVPFYVLPTPGKHFDGVPQVLRNCLASYLYEKWFRPYQSDIEFNQFIAKLIVLMDIDSPDNLEQPSTELIDELSKVTQSIVTYITAAKHHLIARAEKFISEGGCFSMKPVWQRYYKESFYDNNHCMLAQDESETLVGEFQWQSDPTFVSPQRVMQHYSISPLFRSIGIIFYVGNWNVQTHSSSFGQNLVYMFLTGAENPGLSAPITFNTIEHKIQATLQNGPRRAVQVTLETAVDFIMDLERREALASSTIPDTNVKTYFPKPKFPDIYDPLFEGISQWGPSSTWVDAGAREWSGHAAYVDAAEYWNEEQFLNALRNPEKYCLPRIDVGQFTSNHDDKAS